MSRFASVYPLVTARALARPFTYLADGLEKGSVVSVPFGRAHRRGVVVGLEDVFAVRWMQKRQLRWRLRDPE